MYSFTLNETLDWHTDGMRLDYLSKKYACIVDGHGVLEVMDNDGNIESYDFNEKGRWVNFKHLNKHRFITSGAIMVMASTYSEELAKTFDENSWLPPEEYSENFLGSGKTFNQYFADLKK